MLALIWLSIIAFCIIMYVILDGFTLGTGIMLGFLNEKQRDIAMSVILPTWDGNQTWLVLGMASLYGAFPIAFSILLPIFYMPLMIMVIALLLRGVAFEFRLKSAQGKKMWDIIFISSSILTTLIQGTVLGSFVQGFNYLNHVYSLTNVINPFNIITAIGLLIGYSLLGSSRLILKTTENLQRKMYKICFILSILLMLVIFIVSIFTPFVYPLVQERWFNLHYLPKLAILPFITMIAFLSLIMSLYKRSDKLPYWLAVVLFLCPYVGFLISLYPYIIPYHLNLWQAASPNNTLSFLLVGACIMLPVLLFYTGYAYRIFKGKVNETIHY